MSSCTECGHQLGVGRFCTNCGAPVAELDWRTDTAERKLGEPVPASDPRTPPAVVAPPPPPRYPLFADEVDSWTSSGSTAAAEPAGAVDAAEPPLPEEYVDPAPYLGQHDDHDSHEPYYEEEDARRTALPWILTALAVLAIVAAGWWYLARDEGSDPEASGDDPSSETSAGSGPAGSEVSGQASAKAPTTAPPNEDVNGDQVSYDASNMLDGVAETAWRAPGDASGMELVFKLHEATELTRVGLINGYAKTSVDDQGRSFDWYLGNRRVVTVVWVLDKDHKQRQELTETRKMQTVDIDPVTTSRVVLRLVKVSPPGDGTAARDFSAVSEVSLFGSPQG